MPTSYQPGKKYPTIFEMSGYDGGSADGGTLMNDFGSCPSRAGPGARHSPGDSRQLTDLFNGEYVTVHASVRGTGCSGGEFDLFSGAPRSDGKEIIDGWIPKQSWSNGDVGILGHSYGGITGFMVAATQPAHLGRVSVSGLIDDLYRGSSTPAVSRTTASRCSWARGSVRPTTSPADSSRPRPARGRRPATGRRSAR